MRNSSTVYTFQCVYFALFIGAIGEACYWARCLCKTSQGGSLFSPVEALLICRCHTSENKTF